MQTPLNIGVDVASRKVVAACAAGSFRPRSFANERRVLSNWLKELPPGSRIGMEATGSYHQLLTDLAHAAGMVVYVLNPRDVKKYAEGVGRRGKTDRLDAEVIARYVAREHAELHQYLPRSATTRRMEQLLKRRGNLVRLQIALTPAWHGVPGVAIELKAVQTAYARLLKRVDELLKEALAQSPEAQMAAARVRTIPGCGEVSSIAIAHALQWLPFTKVDAFIAHTGLDPRPRDSGSAHGRRRLSKRGPAALRSILHMCGMAASRTATWRPYYERQLAKGLSRTEAVVILARKLARTAYGVAKGNATFNPERVLSSA